MQKLGLAFITLAFLAGALAAVWEPLPYDSGRLKAALAKQKGAQEKLAKLKEDKALAEDQRQLAIKETKFALAQLEEEIPLAQKEDEDLKAWSQKIVPMDIKDLKKWKLYVLCLALGIVGIAMVRIGAKREATAPEKVEADFATLANSLDKVLAQLDKVDQDVPADDPYALPGYIDEHMRSPLVAFADSREAILHVHGADSYADVMTHFAAGERYLHRVWSSAADGYAAEASDYLKRSHDQFQLARTHLRELTQKS